MPVYLIRNSHFDEEVYVEHGSSEEALAAAVKLWDGSEENEIITVLLRCEECGNEQADMGKNVACEACGARMPE